jgi:hypothetical protein
MNQPNYWVVGATWEDDNLEEAFYRRGYWEMGYDDGDKPTLAGKRDSMQPGDRIAVKSRDGQGASTITIKSLGIVKEVADRKVFVNWLVTKMDRQVPCKNYFGTLHGPIGDETWIDRAFRL